MRKPPLWHSAQATMGIVGWIGVAALLNPIIIERTGSGTLLGQVMALIGGAGILAPLIGTISDRYSCHSVLQKFGVFINLIALIVLYFAETAAITYWLVGALIGIGCVSLLVLNPTFVLASSKDQNEESKGLASLFQFQFLGVVLAGVLIAVAGYFEVSSSNQLFILMALLVLVLVALFVSPPPKIHAPKNEASHDSNDTAPLIAKRGSLFVMLLFLLAVFFSMFLSSNLMELGPLLISEVYDVEVGNSALGMAMSAIISIFLLESAGRWMQKVGPFKIWYIAQAAYLVIGSVFWYTAGKSVPAALPLTLLILLMQTMSWNDMVVPAIAGRLSTSSPALTQGLLMFAMAGGFGVGTMVAGLSIDYYGYASVFTVSLAGILASIACIGLLKIATFKNTRRRELKAF
ncbi:MFS transporter [Vibrio cionasavignyae]|uniref:MFS transporter n=1 Tax=Vibrio cionasavignyae TaxID=2910252 RepID=UPI003D0CE772